MTAIIGFCVKNTVFLATDSQMTDTQAGTKRRDSKKIASVAFNDGCGCMIARAGSVATADLFQEIFTTEAAMVGFDEWRTPANVAESAMRKTKQKMLDGFYHTKLQAGDSQQYLENCKCVVLIGDAYVHQVIDHMVSYVEGQVHTNTIENFWALLKRGLRGTYVSVDPAHLHRYLDEQVFRFNNRKTDDAGRFLKASAAIIGKRLTYAELIAKPELA